jgi:hypothetical protein
MAVVDDGNFCRMSDVSQVFLNLERSEPRIESCKLVRVVMGVECVCSLGKNGGPAGAEGRQLIS